MFESSCFYYTNFFLWKCEKDKIIMESRLLSIPRISYNKEMQSRFLEGKLSHSTSKKCCSNVMWRLSCQTKLPKCKPAFRVLHIQVLHSILYISFEFCLQFIIISTYPAGKIAKTLEEWVFVESAYNMRCHIVKNTLLHIAFSAILPAG